MNIDAGRLATLKQRYQKELGAALIKPNGPSTPTPRAILQIGRRLRDEALHQYPILPLAIQVYVELAATREWTISGEPKHVERSLDWVNNAESVNPATGLVDYGYETMLRRKALDHVVIGMTTFAASPDIDDPAPLEYIDPTLLRFRREERRIKNGMVTKVRPEEKCWIYASAREIQSQHLIHNYANPLGANGFTSPILSLLPSASLSWLIRESDTMNIDGRKIRDLILVSDPKIGDAIEQGIYALLSLWKGDSEDDTGIPIIAVNGLQQGMPVRDTFAKLGISEIPETLKREEFTFAYVNEIAAALGLSLRHFWNNERTTNRALEEVQEARQQQKGPNTFVRTEQRLMNRSGFLTKFGSIRKKPRFAFVEETDLSSMKDRAEALKNLATAFGMVMDRMGLFIKPESAVAWFQMENLLPHEIELVDIGLSGQVVNPDSQMNTGNEETVSSDPKPTAEPTQDTPRNGEQLEKSLEYGEIVMSGTSGRVIARRHKIYPIEKILREEIKRDIAAEEKIYEGTYIDETDIKDWLKVLSTEAESHNVRLVQRLGDSPFLDKWLEKHPSDQSAIHNCLKNIDIASDDMLIIDRVALAWEALSDS
jgi:hypothetical protein